MINKISITTFIHIAFTITFVVLLTTFLLFLQYDKKNFHTEQQNRYQLITNGFISGLQFLQNQDELKNLYEHYQVKEIIDWDQRLEILNEGEVIFFRERFDSRVRVFLFEDSYYIYIQRLGFNLMLKDMKPKSYNRHIAFILFATLFSVFYLLYYFIIKKLLPLRELNSKIKRFGNGETDIDLKIEGSDEVATISQNFDKAVCNINSLIKSKNLFMKNFMHELKTPIAKGKITIELLPDSKDKELLRRVFDRMDTIVKDIAAIEKAKIAHLTRKTILFSKLLDNASHLLLDGVKIKQEIEDFSVFVDEEMFTIVLKNLIENAHKYGTKDIILKAKDAKVEICSYAPPLAKPLQYYTDAFTKETSSKGLGLGLYLCQTILNLHQSKLQYTHENGYNCFSFTLQN